MTEMREIRLPADLCGAVEKKFQHKFSNLEELLTLVLHELGRDEASQADEQERRLLEERLRQLGYL